MTFMDSLAAHPVFLGVLVTVWLGSIYVAGSVAKEIVENGIRMYWASRWTYDAAKESTSHAEMVEKFSTKSQVAK